MPMRREDYPSNWPEIARSVKERASWRCEECGIKHGTRRMNAKGQPFREIMTCAHLGVPKDDGSPGDTHDKMDCRPENLACYCTRCHLLYDLADHIATRMRNHHLRRLAELRALHGNKTLFD